MPRSVVLYTSDDVAAEIRKRFAERFPSEKIKPYTCSFAHVSETAGRRMRITELVPYSIAPIIDDVIASGKALPVSAADPDVRGASYEELLSDADRFQRSALLEFFSPTFLSLGGYSVCFPVLPLMLSHYVHVWNSVAAPKITRAPDLLDHVRLKDFNVSCVQTDYGPGFQGWVALEIATGRSEEEIQLFNAILDLTFYCGTGIHTEEGFGQTRRGRAQHRKARKPTR